MTKKYDVVVCGSGNSGLTASITLAQAGKKVLLVEQHNLPGGSASSFCRGRFELEPSLHELGEVGSADNPGAVRKMFDKFGVKIDWIPVPDLFRVISTWTDDGSKMDVTLPKGINECIEAMEKYVPGSKKSMQDFFDLCVEVVEANEYIESCKNGPDSNVLREKYPNYLRTGAYSVTKVFNALKMPQRAQDIWATYWGYLGVDLPHLNFVHYAAMIYTYVDFGPYIPSHTSHEISSALIARFRELGGEVWFNCRAEKFLFDGDKLCGVETSSGTVECEYALPNINPNIVYGKMIPKELIPEREKKLSTARGNKFSGRFIGAYFCLDKTIEELGIKDYTIFMSETSDSEKSYNNIYNGEGISEHSTFVCYNVANKNFSPEGTTVCSFTTLGNPKTWENLSQKEYFKKKEEYAKGCIELLKIKTGIDISGCIEEMSVATP